MANITPLDIKNRKGTGALITMLTAYDYGFGKMIDAAGIDIILVGDSLGMVVFGYDSTIPVTMDEMLHHCRAVSRGVAHALLTGDMPFMSYQISHEKALYNASRFLKEAGCDAVKLEGGVAVAPVIERLVKAGIPVMGHVGLTPQTASILGGFKVQGRDLERARAIYEDAMAVAEAGAFSVVLECIPSDLSALITEDLEIPTIGIGAGPGCDGQVLVTNDLLGLYEKFTPKFAKRYVNLAPSINEALAAFKKEVESGDFPSAAESFSGGEEAVQAIRRRK